MTPYNLSEYESVARERLDPATWGFLAGGSDDEVTLCAERTALQRIRLRPRVLVDATRCDLTTTILGTPVSLPVMAAPIAYHGLFHPEGECATAEGVGT